MDDIPEQVGSLGAWLPRPCLPWASPRTALQVEATTHSASSPPIPIPSRQQQRSEQRHQQGCFMLFEPRIVIASPQQRRDPRDRPQLAGHTSSFTDLFGDCTEAEPVAPNPPAAWPMHTPAAAGGLEDCSVGRRRAAAAQRGSPNSVGPPQQQQPLIQRKPVSSRLRDGYQITAGPLGPSASLPTQGPQAPVGLAQLCKALSSPSPHMAREASRDSPSPTPHDGGGARRCKATAAVSALSEAFDAARAIAAFERSTVWAAAGPSTSAHGQGAYDDGGRASCGGRLNGWRFSQPPQGCGFHAW